MFLILSLILTLMLGTKNIDVLGHLGGFITGIILGFWCMPCLEQGNMHKIERARNFSKWAKVATCLWLSTMLLCFYLFRSPVDTMGKGVTVSPKVEEVEDAMS